MAGSWLVEFDIGGEFLGKKGGGGSASCIHEFSEFGFSKDFEVKLVVLEGGFRLEQNEFVAQILSIPEFFLEPLTISPTWKREDHENVAVLEYREALHHPEIMGMEKGFGQEFRDLMAVGDRTEHHDPGLHEAGCDS